MTATLEDEMNDKLEFLEKHLIDDTVVFVFVYDPKFNICTGCSYTI